MKAVLMLLSVLFFFVAQQAIANEKLTLPTYSKYYDDKRDPFIDAKAAIALAKKSNRQVLIEVGGNWCDWCKKMDVFLASHQNVYQALHQNFVVLKVNVSDSNENEAFMKSLPPTMGYPHMYVSTNTGKMLLSKDTAELLENGEYNTDKWLAFLDKWQEKNNMHNVAKNKG